MMLAEEMRVTVAGNGLELKQNLNPMTENRVGVFAVSRKLLQYADWEELTKFFSHFVIVRAEMKYVMDSIEYVAYSSLFEIASDNDCLPEYKILASREGDKITYHAE